MPSDSANPVLLKAQQSSKALPAMPITLTRPILPELSRYSARLESAWDASWLTNNGALLQELQAELCSHLKVPYLSVLNNGTTALMVALSALGVSGEVITTPFTFPATVHALTWLGLTPVFCDIDPISLTVSPEQIEQAIGPRTTAILGVHLFGNVCDVKAMRDIADKHDLKLIFDGAHSFGTEIDNIGVGNFGDATIFSMHATKLFNTAEGGAISVREQALFEHISDLSNFGIRSEFEVVAAGINGKMNELQAALGLEVLPLIAAEQSCRRVVRDYYRARLGDIPGVRILELPDNVVNNQQFLVLKIDETSPAGSADAVYARLREHQIYARRYFSPLISDYDHYRHLPSAIPENLPIAQQVSREILCLPFYGDLSEEDLSRICDLIDIPLPSAKQSNVLKDNINVA